MKIYAVCGFGCGSSMILKMGMDKVFNKLGQSVEVDISDMATVGGNRCDAIFTSNELAQELRASSQVPIYTVEKYVDLEEIETVVKEFLKDNGIDA